jgi:hypothetical protein
MTLPLAILTLFEAEAAAARLDREPSRATAAYSPPSHERRRTSAIGRLLQSVRSCCSGSK